MNNCKIFFILLSLLVISCSREGNPFSDKQEIGEIAESYVRLALDLGKFDKDFVDSYFGPKNIKEISGKDKFNNNQIKDFAGVLLANLKKLEGKTSDKEFKRRYDYLQKQLNIILARIDFLNGKKLSFDNESREFYGVVSPVYPLSYYNELLVELNNLLPGRGNLTDKYNTFKRRLIVPAGKVDLVFKSAIAEARKISLQHINLPEKESFTVEYVKGVPWKGYNWFKGNSYSLIQINIEQPIYIGDAVGLACHEGYPGHHVFHSTIENEMYKTKGWVEYSIYPLFSPMSLISEGLANYAIGLAFPDNERIKFEKTVLYPLCGLNPELAETDRKVRVITKKLSYAGTEAARRYIDNRITREQAIDWIMKYTLKTRPEAENSISFINKYRSYIINYNVGENLVKKYIESKGGTINNSQKQWEEYKRLLSNPFILLSSN